MAPLSRGVESARVKYLGKRSDCRFDGRLPKRASRQAGDGLAVERVEDESDLEGTNARRAVRKPSGFRHENRPFPDGFLVPHRTPSHPIVGRICDIFKRLGFWLKGRRWRTTGMSSRRSTLPMMLARDMQDTFFVRTIIVVLRTHTSSVQTRVMEKTSPPIRIICQDVFTAMGRSHTAPTAFSSGRSPISMRRCRLPI